MKQYLTDPSGALDPMKVLHAVAEAYGSLLEIAHQPQGLLLDFPEDVFLVNVICEMFDVPPESCIQLKERFCEALSVEQRPI